MSECDTTAIVCLSSSHSCESDEEVHEESRMMQISQETVFLSFAHLKSFLTELFSSHGLRVRARDTKHPNGIGKEHFCEENVTGRKYECCVTACSWHAWFRKDRNGMITLGRKYSFMHSHPVVFNGNGMLQRGSREFTTEEKTCLESLRRAGVKGTKSHRFMELLFGTTYKEWAIRNYIRRDRPQEIINDAMNFIEMIGETSLKGKTIHSIHADEEGSWDMIFVGLKEGLDDYIENGCFFSIDATANTNRYGLLLVTVVSQDYVGKIKAIAYAFVPRESADCYAWVMKQLKHFFNEWEPVLIISDNHPSIHAAITQVFPEAIHRLCWKHLKDHIRQRIKDKKTCKLLGELKSFRLADHAYKEFDAIAQACDTPYMALLKKWLPKWCDSFLPNTFVGRRNTTSINESQHARLKLTLNSSSTLVDTFKKILQCKDAENITPKMKTMTIDVTGQKPLSPLAVHLIEVEMRSALTKCIASKKETRHWSVKEKVFDGYDFNVSTNRTDEFTCSCGYPEQMELPCRHIITVFSLEQRMQDLHMTIGDYWFPRSARSEQLIIPSV
eukprot:TRINITY_DN512_c5_g1_i1.p1 TRINITY_DN512_c5_g1~~TRINITY_DN512_c5_g1_i1.p1  ORF type:complete len:558 (-),score=90.41 TRINITY_DN512_c5_g1_i1:20-1693(-)